MGFFARAPGERGRERSLAGDAVTQKGRFLQTLPHMHARARAIEV